MKYENDPDTKKDPIDFLIECAWAYAEEYLISRPDLKKKIEIGEQAIWDELEQAHRG